MPPPTDAEGPLSGIRILDFTTMMSGPLGTRLLADMGADVVKVEAPPGGDHNRARTPIRGGMSRYFAQLNAGKRSILLDLKDPADNQAGLALATRADVVVENNRPGVMSRLGLGYEALSARNPAVVYCSISGFGQTGPGSAKAAYAPNIHAYSGYDLANLGYQDRDRRDRPANTAIFVADALAAVYACTAIEAALVGRSRTGKGQYIDLALGETMLNVMVYEMQLAQLGEAPRRSVYGPMPTTDGFVSVAPVSQRQFQTLVQAIGRPEWVNDERWSNVGAREENWEALMEAVAGWTSARTTKECVEVLTDAGVAVAPYRTPAEVLLDDQLAHRGTFSRHADDGGEYLLLNPPFTFADGSVHARANPPALGGDRAEVLRDWLDESPTRSERS
jgi:CoA:oxalate CoA-transferase